MDSDMFLEATLGDSGLQGRLHAARQERMGGAELSDLASCRKEPDRMTVGEPVRAQQGEQGRRERDVAVLGPLTALNMDHHPCTVDLRHAQMNTFTQA